MNGTAAALLTITAVLAVIDWIAVATARRGLEYVAKPLTTAGLVAVACTLDPVDHDVRVAFVVALVLSLAGDVFLMLPGERWFVPGLASFLLAHVAYVTGFVLGPGTAGELLVGAIVTAVVAVPLGLRLLRAVARDHTSMRAPVAAYLTVISVMVACATGWGNVWAISGAWCFFASDALIGETRFVHPTLEHAPGWRLAVIVTYHVGQVGLALSLVH